MKDWIGNSKSTYTTLGASNHSNREREQHDYYATEPKAAELLLELEQLNKNIWECACGEGHLSNVFIKNGFNVYQTDLINRGGHCDTQLDFLKCNTHFPGDIITNPPYKYAKEFVEHALELVQPGNKVIMFLKLTFLEGKARKQLFEEHPPKTVYVSSSRLKCAMNGEFETIGSSAAAYCWYVWEKGYKGPTTLKWFN